MDTATSTRRAFQERVDLRQDPRYKNFVEKIGFKSITIPTNEGEVFGYIKYVPFTGIGLLKIQRYKGEINHFELKKQIRKHGVWRTILEPINDPSVLQIASKNKDPFLPTMTRVIEVDSLGKDFSQNVKRIIRKQSNLQQGSTTVEQFYDAWKKNSKIWTLSKYALDNLAECFGDDCVLWIEEREGVITGGIVCLIVDQWAYYFAAFVSNEGRKDNSGVWGVVGLLEELKRRKVKYLDFEGIFDERFPRKSWKGFSEFKSRFGGVTVELPGCFGRWF